MKRSTGIKTQFQQYPIKLIFVSLVWALTNSMAFAQSTPDTLTYVVKEGDSLSEIGQAFGDINSWITIYEANRDKISDPDKIYPKQTLKIPSFIAITKDIFRLADQKEEITNQDNVKKAQPDSSEMLKEFRKAFDGVAKADQQKKQKKAKESAPSNGLEFGGLVVNRTTSKMGRDFFNAFYDQWEAPEEAGNFFLEISEQPMPSMGAMVLIKIDNQIIYKTRLQPRNDLIDQVVNKSVAMCYRHLYQQLSSTKPTIY